MTIGVGVVGCGLIGAKRARAVTGLGRVVAVYDVDEQRALAMAGTATVEPELDTLLARPDVDLVVVATTHDALGPVARAAAAAGKHVLVEKPGGLDLAALVALRDTADANGVLVRVGFNHRFHPGLRLARSLVADRPGESVLYVRGRYGHGGRLGYEQEWRADRARSGGGELIDQGSHLIDLVRYLVGDVQLAFAELTTGFWPMAVEDNAFVALRPERGGVAWLHASWTEWKNLFSLEVALTGCKIEVNGLGGSYGTESLTVYEMTEELGPPPSRSWSWPPGDDSWRLEVADVLAHLDGAPPEGATLDDAIAVMAIIDEVYRT